MFRIYICIALTLGLMGCDKWLDVKPKTQISEKAIFEDEQGFKDALIGVYTLMADQSLYAKELTMGFMDVLSQNYLIGSTHTYYQASQYNYTDAATQNKMNLFWNNSYKAIANINNLLANIDAKKDLFTKNNYALIKGEALGLRAFLHFDLLRMYGPVPVGNEQQKSIPYKRSFKMAQTSYGTLEEVIKDCLLDAQEAEDLLSVDTKVRMGDEDLFLAYTRNHFNYWAVLGLQARIHLYIGDSEHAFTFAKRIIDNTALFPFVQSAALAGKSTGRTFPSEHLFGLHVTNLQNINATAFLSTVPATMLLSNTENFKNALYETVQFGSSDYRYMFLWQSEGSSLTSYPAKYWQQDLTASSSALNRIPLIKLSEIYYIAAETAGASSSGVTYLNNIRKNRGIAALTNAAVDTPEKFEQEIFKEYSKEFYQEGQLFYYYKRKNKKNIVGTAKIMDNRVYQFPLPDSEIEFAQK